MRGLRAEAAWTPRPPSSSEPAHKRPQIAAPSQLRVRDPAGLPRTALWADGHRTGRFVASIPCRRARASATSTAATSKPPARPPFTHHKQTPHTAAAAARARCRAATPLEAGCNERSTYIHPQGTVVTARYAQNALLWPGTRQTAANSQQRPSGGPLTATARAAILLVLRSNPRGTNPSLV